MVGGIVFSAMLIGTAAGARLGGDMTRMYMKFFRIPDYSYWPSLLPLGSAGLCLLAALAGVLGRCGARRGCPSPRRCDRRPCVGSRPRTVHGRSGAASRGSSASRRAWCSATSSAGPCVRSSR
ncbi:MAG: hypothetical protein U1F77_16865 [Kiritimatiellia bacterium]